ncbi:MAG: trimeric intracellular cation channel family protein [Pseudomonadota bacterium]
MLYLLDLFGIVVFALSGALVAREKGYDLFGGLVLAVATAIGGGSFRDLSLGRTPLFWLSDVNYLALASLTAILCLGLFRLAPAVEPSSRVWQRSLITADALGLAAFTVIGTQIGLSEGLSPIMAAVMGTVSACFGGVLRDVLAAREPLIFHREIYATAALAGALSWLLLENLAGANIATACSIAITVGLRVVSAIHGWRLPRYRSQREGKDRH